MKKTDSSSNLLIDYHGNHDVGNIQFDKRSSIDMSNIKYFTNGTTGAVHSTKHRKGVGTEKITPN